MAITFFGAAVSPSDGGSQYTDSVRPPELLAFSVTPPADMVAGQLVVMDAIHRATSTLTPGAFELSETGGQTWTVENKVEATSAISGRRYWCRFNGTWSASPSVNFDNYKANGTASLVMSVYSPDSAGATWQADTAFASDTILAAQDLVVTGVTTNTNGAVVVSTVATPDDNNHALQVANNFSSAVLGADNVGGSDICVSTHYCVKATAGSTGTYTLRETVNGNDLGLYLNQAFKELPADRARPFIAPVTSVLSGPSSVSGTGSIE